MSELYELLTQLTAYRGILRISIAIVVMLMVAVAVINAVRNLKRQMDANRQEQLRDDNLRNVDYDTFSKKEKATVLRNAIVADAIDPGPNKYMVISDGGTEVYVRTFTISSLPNKVRFAKTFSDLMNFKNCESSVFVNPIAEDEMLNRMNKHIDTLYGEDYTAGKNANLNRQRSLRGQIQDANDFAEQIEAGDTKFYDVGFLFTLHADSVKELNVITQEFHSVVLKNGAQISNCYAIQAEAFAMNGPWNRNIKVTSGTIPFDGIKFFSMDKRSVSTLYNYTQMSFSHKNGVILGLDMFTAAPVVYDTFDGAHDGYTIVVAGKVGTGKSAMVKMMICREILQGNHFVCIDSKQRKGTSEGEYAALAVLCDGANFQISNSSNDVMNIFDIGETTRNIKDENNVVHEIRTLELNDKITMLTDIILKLIHGGDTENVQTEFKDDVYLRSVVESNLKSLYKSFGFIEGDADSLYTHVGAIDASYDNSTMRNGRPLKLMPTMTDFYRQILISARDNHDDSLTPFYNIVKMALQNYVKEFYYSEQTVTVFTAERYKKLQFNESAKARTWTNPEQITERIIEVHGIRPYFDGQSSIHLDRDCPFTNIDISLLPDAEKELTRQVALAFVNENFIKRNSLSLDMNAKMEVIMDEAHELFKNKYDRATLEGVSRTARSRNVALWLISQTLKEYDTYPETQAILKQAATKFVLKQDPADRDYLINTISLTEAQASLIVDVLGGNPDDESDQNKHRGEVCIIDNKTVAFCKVAYRKSTEALAVATDAKGIEEAFASASRGA